MQHSLFSMINVVVISIGMSITFGVHSSNLLSKPQVKVLKGHQLDVYNKTQKKQFIVQFEAAPTINFQRKLNTTKNTQKSKLSNSNIEQQMAQYESSILDTHMSFEREIKRLSQHSKLNKRFSKLVNAAVVTTEITKQQLETLSGVKKVYPVRRYSHKLSNALSIVKAVDAWQLLGGMEQAGQGIKIAVIDSGIIPEHAMFDDSGMTAPTDVNLETEDYCRETDETFCNNKLIVARYYLPSFVDLEGEHDYEYETPRGVSGHGTHVAGIATGRQVTADNGDVISGVAPGAYLMSYKALWGQDGDGSDIELLAALEDAYADGADVINNSWGGNSGGSPNSSLYQGVFEELEANGVIIVTAAGNEGVDASGNVVESSISCPGCIEAGITVGATTTDLIYGLPITYGDGVIYGLESDSFSLNSALQNQVQIAPENNELGCSNWDEDLTDKIALVSRGECFFEEKANIAEAAGASAIIVINNQTGENITMAMGEATLPAVMISIAQGELLTTYLTDNPSAEISIAASPVLGADSSEQDKVASFSSLGPNGDTSFIKPDLAAPGALILSATSEEDAQTLDENYARLSGTSMATPVVAGAAALLKQSKPELSAIQIKNVLINSSDAVVRHISEDREATAFETGAGRLNIVNALEATAYANQPNMVGESCLLSCTLSNQIVSLSDVNTRWTGVVTFDNENITAQIAPNELLLSPSSSADFNLQVNVPRSLESSWYFGRLVWTNEDGETVTQAIAISTEQGENNAAVVNITEVSTDVKRVSIDVSNLTTEDTVELDLQVTGAAEFDTQSLNIDTDSVYETSQLSEQQITVSANLSSGTAQINSGEVPVQVNLTEESVEPITCDLGGCDEVAYSIEFDFIHYGQTYSGFLLNENGLIIAGEELGDDVALYINRNFPDEELANNIIAPFWSDFDLINEALENDTGGGYMYVALYEIDNTNYMIIQWEKVKLYTDESVTPEVLGVSSADVEFSFQLILEQNSENKWFRYIDIPEQPNFYSVGLENSTGTQGFSYWYDDSGEQEVSTDDELAIEVSGGGSFTLNADILKTTDIEFAVDDEYEITAGVNSEFNVIGNDFLSTSDAELMVNVAGTLNTYEIFSDITDVTLLSDTVAITSTPNNGTATVLDNGFVSYTADLSFEGIDSFEYQIENSQGDISSATVTVNVVSALMPEITIIGETTIAAGSSQSYSLDISAGFDDLTYQWILPEELTSSEISASTLTLVAADVSENTTVVLAIEVTYQNIVVQDSITIIIESATDDSSENDANNDEESDSGFLGLAISWQWALSLLLLIAWRRRLRL